DPGAIELRRQDGTPVNFRIAISATGGKTVAVLTFAGPEFVGGSLADGRYTLTVRADRVHDRWGRGLDGDGGGSAGGESGGCLLRSGGAPGGRRGGGGSGPRPLPLGLQDGRRRPLLPGVLRLRRGRRRGRPRQRPVQPPLRPVLTRRQVPASRSELKD